MRIAIRDAELRTLPPDARRARMDALLAETSREPNGELRELDRKLAEYEQKYGRTSAEMAGDVAAGVQAETWEICQWLMTYHLRRDLAEVTTQSG